MTIIEIILNIILFAFIEISAQMIISNSYLKHKKMEAENEKKAKQFKYVKMDKHFVLFFTICAIILNIIGVVIIVFPKLITSILGLNYITTILIWWVLLIFSNIILFFMFTEAKYNDTYIIVKKALTKPKVYKFDEIISFTIQGNLRIKTNKGAFTLLNAMAGTNALRDVLKSKNILL